MYISLNYEILMAFDYYYYNLQTYAYMLKKKKNR